MPTVTFQPSGLSVPCSEQETVFEVARRHGVPVETSCVGRGTCGLCRVKVLEGEANLTPFNAVEKKHLGNVYFITKERLACQARVVSGDVTVGVTIRRV